MSIILTPTPLTDDIKIKQINTQLLMAMKSGVTRGFEIMWMNGRTPKAKDVCQATLNAFGTSASQLFLGLQKLQEVIALVDPTWVPLVPPYAFTVNQDGSVTLT